MPVESPGTVSVRGRFGSLQVVSDAQDTEIAVPAGSTHMELHFDEVYQPILYSLLGTANNWLPLKPRAHMGPTQFRIALGAAAKVWFRKAYNGRMIQERVELIGYTGLPDARMNLSDDQIVSLVVTFHADT